MLDYRSDEIEIMDDLEISGEVVNQTLRELNTINRLLGGNQISIQAFKKFARNKNHVRLADLGCGGGDIMAEMANWCHKKKIEAQFVGIDANKNIVSYAERNTANFDSISYQVINIFSEEFQQQDFDIIHCCLFTHHFSDQQLIELFRQFKQQAGYVIINDLHRHPLAYWSIKVLTRLFSKSSMVRNDASVSVARGFKKKELTHILERAGIDSFELSWKWAFRWKLVF